MCGIVGILSKDKKAINESIDVLKKLEYRGYDSCGIAFFDVNNNINIKKTVGKIKNLEKILIDQKLISNESLCSIAHTRWATHGEVNEINTHPHISDNVILIQNGIIENYQSLKEELKKDGYTFYSSTDTEVLTKLIDKYYIINNHNPLLAIKDVKNIIKGNYSVVFMVKNKPNELYGFCNNTPFIIASNNNNFYISSDINSINEYIKDNLFYFLDNNDIVNINLNDIIFFDNNLSKVSKKPKHIANTQISKFDKGIYDDFMIKEINEQSSILLGLINNHYINKQINFNVDKIVNQLIFDDVQSIRIIGCGSAYNSGLIGKYFFESICNLKTEVCIASEFRYANYISEKNCLNIIISQSGETADTLACLDLLNDRKEKVLSIVNTKNSTIDNRTENVIYMNCMNEYSVASTKAYTAQVLILILIALKLSKNIELVDTHIDDLIKCINNAHNLLDNCNLKSYAKEVSKYKNIFFIGRLINYYLCQEAALKLKEISYINSNAYPSGELKHGPISLIDENTLSIGLISNIDELTLKTISNINEIKTRKGKILLIAPSGAKQYLDDKDLFIDNLSTDSIFSFFSTIYLFQLLAYYVAKELNNDVDNPKNLAKSVTVE